MATPSKLDKGDMKQDTVIVYHSPNQYVHQYHIKRYLYL